MNATASKTQRVRIKLLMNADGKWAAYGWTDSSGTEADHVLFDMMSDENIATAREFWVVADIPIPDPVDIEGAVQP